MGLYEILPLSIWCMVSLVSRRGVFACVRACVCALVCLVVYIRVCVLACVCVELLACDVFLLATYSIRQQVSMGYDVVEGDTIFR